MLLITVKLINLSLVECLKELSLIDLIIDKLGDILPYGLSCI